MELIFHQIKIFLMQLTFLNKHYIFDIQLYKKYI